MKFISLVLFTMLASCSSVKILTSWKANDLQPAKVNSILVLAIINEKDKQFADRMEAHFAGELTDLGYTATCALQQYGPKAFDSLTEKAALDKVAHANADAVFTIVLVDKNEEMKYVPGQAIYTGGDIWQAYPTQGRTVYEPGYMVNTAKYFWESNLYDLKSKKLLFSIQTNVFNPESAEKMGHEYGKIIIANMLKQKVLRQRIVQE